jgi:hypothetical protein
MGTLLPVYAGEFILGWLRKPKCWDHPSPGEMRRLYTSQRDEQVYWKLTARVLAEGGLNRSPYLRVSVGDAPAIAHMVAT